MLRIASAAFVLFTVLISTSVIPSSSAEAGYYGVRYGGLCGGAVYGPPVYGPRGYGYRGGYYGRSNRPLATAPYYVNGCYNGYSDDGVYCYVYVGCPYNGHRYQFVCLSDNFSCTRNAAAAIGFGWCRRG